MKRKTKRLAGKAVGNIYAIIIFAFLYVPVITLVAFSFNDSRANNRWVGFTTDYYVKLFTGESELWQSMVYTLEIAVMTMLLAIIIGTIGAVALARNQFKLKGLVGKLIYIPLIVPEVVIAAAYFSLMMLFNIPLGTLAIIIGHVTLVLPYMVINVRSRMSGFDKSLEEASLDLGADRRVTFFKVTLPLIIPGIMSGAFLAFTISLDNIVMSNFLVSPGSNTLPITIYSHAKMGIPPTINGLVTVMTAVMLCFVLIRELVKKAIDISNKKKLKELQKMEDQMVSNW